MNVRYRVELNQCERDRLTALLSGGKHAARKLKRAQILLAADAGASDEDIARDVGGGRLYRVPDQAALRARQLGGGAQRRAAAGGKAKAVRQGASAAGRDRLFQATRRAGALDARTLGR